LGMRDRSHIAASFSIRAEIALESLSDTDRKKVMQKIDLLLNRGLSKLGRSLKKLKGYPDIYVLRVTPNLRIILQYDELEIDILDIVRSDRLHKMYGT